MEKIFWYKCCFDQKISIESIEEFVEISSFSHTVLFMMVNRAGEKTFRSQFLELGWKIKFYISVSPFLSPAGYGTIC